MLAFDLQGGGLLVYGTATLTNSNIYSNSANSVRARLCVTFHRPAELTAARGLQGGGVYVASNGVANFEDCNIHDNTAYDVCLPSALALNFHPSPRWNVTCVLVGGRVAEDFTSKAQQR